MAVFGYWQLTGGFLNGWLDLELGQVYPTHREISAKLEISKGLSAMNDNGKTTRVLFCGPDFPSSHDYTKEYLAGYPYIQLIMQFGVGLEGVDTDAATKAGIQVARIPGDITGNAASCAEMSIYLMLGLLRKQNEIRISVEQMKLGEPIGVTLLGKTVFILGFGNIGVELAKRLRPFGVKIFATKRSWSPSQLDGFTNDFVDEKGSHSEIYDFAGKADIIVCCMSMSKDTAGIINDKFLSSMRKGTLLINVARGGLMDYDAVYHHLESGNLGGLGTDVAWKEPFDPNDKILKMKNVLLTPHVAGVTEHSYRSMAKVVGDVALLIHAGSPLSVVEIVN
ncbi:hypothetical protein MLD38_032975 [Melastoma candidum]|uniref:Uncharacterized protein n=1 Tax=Melastoma candidum TaxID=119954 RepID=A0ACB9M5V2_9MYRT|nr:hypothetical protein MLD38_032975 [Melastoma candidum]